MIASEILILVTGLITFSTTIVGSTACAYFCSTNGRTNIAVLKDKKHTLEILLNELQQKLVILTRAVVVMPDPAPWIRKAQNFLNGLDVIDLEERLKAKCINELLPNCYVQRGARIFIQEKFPVMDALTEEGQRVMQALTIRGFKQLHGVTIAGNSRIDTTEEIWGLVSAENEPGTIFIHGTFGLGKTAIAKFIHNKALEDSALFDYVIWATMVDGAGLWQVQEDIAGSLRIDMSDFPRSGDTVERAWKLNDVLLQKQNFLLVLDSMWQAFSLQEIGIPEPVDGYRRKLIITSRIRNVCKKIKSRKSVELKPLHVDEAWDLFYSEIGSSHSSLHPETLNSTESVVAELDGLPLAINKLAQTFNEIQEENSDAFNSEWMKELDDLATMPVITFEPRDQESFDRFKRSYETLKERTRSCLLYCALYPKNHLIKSKELIDYWMWEGLLGNIETLEESIRQGNDTLTELKNAHLLESVTREGSEVKMLNFVRLMVIDTMAEAGNRALIRSGAPLTVLPLGHEWPSEVEKASFINNHISDLRFRSEPNCNRLSTLLLQGNPLNSDNDEHFFYNMRDLRVLDLSQTGILTLPKSLSNLKKLRALLLRGCQMLRKLPNLSNLRDLIVLDLSGTPLDHFPEGIQSMTKLRRLDLSQAGFKTFPANVVGKLIKLEELLMISDDNGGYVWGSKELDEKWEGACIEELVGLGNLVVIQLNFINAKVFDLYVTKVERATKVPDRFRFCVGEFQSGGYAGKNSVTISGSDIGTPANWTNSVPELNVSSLLKLRNLNVLDVSNLSGLHTLFVVEIVGSLTNLMELLVRSCKDMEVVLQPAGEGTIFLPKLTKMVFFDLPKLKSLCCGEVLNCPNLRSVEVWRCENLKLPMIYPESRSHESLNLPIKIQQIRGERSWFNNLEWDNPRDNSDPHFQVSPQSNSNFRLVEVDEPPEFTATSRLQRRMLQECGRSSSSSNILANVLQTKVDIKAFGVYCLLFACGGVTQAQSSWIEPITLPINWNDVPKGTGLLVSLGTALPFITALFVYRFTKH